MSTPKERKKAPKWFIALFIVAVLFIVIKCMRGDDNPQIKETENVAWEKMSYEQKEAWIQYRIENNDGGISITNLKDAIAKHLNYPNDVNYSLDETPTLQRGRIVDAETGTVFIEGSGTGKNAFGVKEAFKYAINLKVTKDSMYIADVSVNASK
ncbi:hypothetical protein ABDK00_001565 [Niabella insulamsoli]|uniref:hypothetical protein n=1 Tax=Niabella insulamsoli TaxID=3144874 RepID=UPI0031FCEFD6